MSEGKFLVSDSFPGNERNKLCMASKVMSLDVMAFRML